MIVAIPVIEAIVETIAVKELGNVTGLGLRRMPAGPSPERVAMR